MLWRGCTHGSYLASVRREGGTALPTSPPPYPPLYVYEMADYQLSLHVHTACLPAVERQTDAGPREHRTSLSHIGGQVFSFADRPATCVESLCCSLADVVLASYICVVDQHENMRYINCSLI